jgi:hypothetical protein
MRFVNLPILSALASLALAASPVCANLLVNEGFEDPVTTDGAPFVGFWEAFNAGAGSSSANSALMPRTGLQSLELSILSTDNSFAGAFQDVTGLTPGMEYIFSGWHATTSSPLDLGTEVRIEWRESVGGTEISRTPNSTPIPGASYSPFDLTAAVPVGADTARLVYAIQTFGAEPGNNGTVFIDDMSFVAVPEPSSLILAGIGGLALVVLQRRRRD